jgi:hypothetical protein
MNGNAMSFPMVVFWGVMREFSPFEVIKSGGIARGVLTASGHKLFYKGGGQPRVPLEGTELVKK